MGIFKPGFPRIRQVIGLLVGGGERKGLLKSRSILSATFGAIFLILDNNGVDLPFTPEDAEGAVYDIAELLGFAGAAWFRAIAKTPTRVAPAP